MRGPRPKDRHVRRLSRNLASSVIRSINEIGRGDAVVLCCRVSRCQQRHAGNLADQEADMRQVLARRGARVVGVVRHIGSGADPRWLEEAAALAKRHSAKLVAETTNRFIRDPDYNSKLWPEAKAGECELEFLRLCTGGVPLVTILPPDATWQAERAYHTKRGQRQKGRSGGRPRKTKPGAKKARRLALQPEVQRLIQEGLSNRAIAKRVETDEKNVRRWRAAFFDARDAPPDPPGL